MSTLQKLGGVAAFIEAAAYAFGIALGFTVLTPFMAGSLDQVQTVAFIAEHQATLYLWNQVIFVVFGVALVILALALHERLKAGAPALMMTATAFGLIWAGLVIAGGMVFNVGTRAVVDLYGTDPAQAGAAWLAISVVQDGLGGGNELVGGLWTLLASWVALRTGRFAKPLGVLGLMVGVAGLLTVVPGLGGLGLVFGLGQLIWFAWLGIDLVGTNSRAAAPENARVRSASQA